MLFSSVTLRICLALASSALTQTTAISLYIPGADTYPLIRSVVTPVRPFVIHFLAGTGYRFPGCNSYYLHPSMRRY